MILEKPDFRLLNAIVMCATLLSLVGCNLVSETKCDPSDATFGKSFICGNQYASRSERLQQEVQDAADRAAQQEQQLSEAEKIQSQAQAQLEQLQRKLNDNQQRIDLLRQESTASETQLAELQSRLNSVQQQSQTLREPQTSQTSNSVDLPNDEVQAQIELLLEEEAELEALLLDLES